MMIRRGVNVENAECVKTEEYGRRRRVGSSERAGKRGGAKEAVATGVASELVSSGKERKGRGRKAGSSTYRTITYGQYTTMYTIYYIVLYYVLCYSVESREVEMLAKLVYCLAFPESAVLSLIFCIATVSAALFPTHTTMVTLEYCHTIASVCKQYIVNPVHSTSHPAVPLLTDIHWRSSRAVRLVCNGM